MSASAVLNPPLRERLAVQTSHPSLRGRAGRALGNDTRASSPGHVGPEDQSEEGENKRAHGDKELQEIFKIRRECPIST